MPKKRLGELSVQSQNPVSRLQQAPDEMPADKASGPGDQNKLGTALGWSVGYKSP
jgi:hypothetical protein